MIFSEISKYAGVKLTNANFSNSIMIGVNLEKAYLDNSDFSNFDLTGAQMRYVSMFNSTLVGANLEHTYISNANLSFTKLSNTDF
jgi:uncharacterized protein YjbI with pentapeptide repeats